MKIHIQIDPEEIRIQYRDFIGEDDIVQPRAILFPGNEDGPPVLRIQIGPAASNYHLDIDLSESPEFRFDAAEMAEFVNLSTRRIIQLAPELEADGSARKYGRDWRFSETAIDYIQNRPDGRGRAKTN